MEIEKSACKKNPRVIQQRGGPGGQAHIVDNRKGGSRNYLSATPIQRQGGNTTGANEAFTLESLLNTLFIERGKPYKVFLTGKIMEYLVGGHTIFPPGVYSELLKLPGISGRPSSHWNNNSFVLQNNENGEREIRKGVPNDDTYVSKEITININSRDSFPFLFGPVIPDDDSNNTTIDINAVRCYCQFEKSSFANGFMEKLGHIVSTGEYAVTGYNIGPASSEYSEINDGKMPLWYAGAGLFGLAGGLATGLGAGLALGAAAGTGALLGLAGGLLLFNPLVRNYAKKIGLRLIGDERHVLYVEKGRDGDDGYKIKEGRISHKSGALSSIQ